MNLETMHVIHGGTGSVSVIMKDLVAVAMSLASTG